MKLPPLGRLLLRLLSWLVLTVAGLWAAAALAIDGPGKIGAIIFLVAGLVLLRWGRWPVVGLIVAVIVWWECIPARNDRDWLPDVAQLATADFQNNLVTVRNIRNFDYRSETEFTPRWDTRRYDLDQLTGCDLFISYWGPKHIAHTITSWEFSDGQYLAVSIETRKEKGETYSALLGFFRQFELYYVVADERDVVGLRTNHRGEQVFLYRLTMSPVDARALLVDYLQQVNRLAAQPVWYNAATDNCTTTIRHHLKHVMSVQSFSWKMLVNGHLDELMYERGKMDTSAPFAEVRQRCEISAKAKAAAGSSEFSKLIRVRP